MKLKHVLVLCSLYLMAACGGGGGGSGETTSAVPPAQQPPAQTPQTPLAIADTADHYVTAFFMRSTHGVVVGLADPTQVYSEWTSAPGYDQFGESYEYSSARTCNGVMYAYADGYGGPGRAPFYGIEAVIDRVTDVNGVTVDLAQLCPGRPGSFIPWNLPAAGSIIVEQWFWILNNDGSRNRPGYWKGTYRLGEFRLNPCWQGTGSNNRQVLVLFETWWDAAGGWVRGHPNKAQAAMGKLASTDMSGPLPWLNNVPQEVQVTPEGEDDYGRDAGPLWRGRDSGVELCLKSS